MLIIMLALVFVLPRQPPAPDPVTRGVPYGLAWTYDVGPAAGTPFRLYVDGADVRNWHQSDLTVTPDPDTGLYNYQAQAPALTDLSAHTVTVRAVGMCPTLDGPPVECEASSLPLTIKAVPLAPPGPLTIR